MVEEPAEVLHFSDTFSHVAEQVINVPKIILEGIPMRTLAREPQLVEQPVEVPAVPQTVGTPILTFLRVFRSGGGQGPTAFGGTASSGRHANAGRRARPKDPGADRGGGGG